MALAPEVELQNASLTSAGGSHQWLFFLYFIFPVPLLFLILLSIPLPNKYRRHIRLGILTVLDKLTFIKFEFAGASLTLISLIIFVALAGFGFSATETYNNKMQENNALFFAEKKEIRCKRWRSERNFWISLLGLILWLVLWRIQGLLNDVGPLEEKFIVAEKEREEAHSELAAKDTHIRRLQDTVDNDTRLLQEKDDALKNMRLKEQELATLQAKVARLEIENENLSRASKKSS